MNGEAGGSGEAGAGGRLLSVGLTGGIACGRSTVGSYFSALGACVVDMDEVAHDLMKPSGEAVGALTAAFGEKVVDAAGGIDRRRLGGIVFHDAGARRRLEAILHPMIRAAAGRIIEAFARSRGGGIAITDAALLVETGGYRRYHRLIVVSCRPELQLERLMKRDGLSEQEASARIAAQLPLADKERLADYIIETSGSRARTQARAREVFGLLQEDLDRLPDLPRRRAS